MITNILEFKFSNHYFYDDNNRFKSRVKDAKILNNLENKEKAEFRFKQVMYNLLLTQLDKMTTKNKNVGIIIGEVVFIQNGKFIPAIIQGDNNSGNLYVAVIKNETVVTLLLLKNTLTNEEILDQFNNHNKRKDLDTIDKLIDINGITINSKLRNKIVVNLNMTDAEFYTKYSSPVLTQNAYSKNGFTELDAKQWKEKEIIALKDKVVMSGTIIPADLKESTPEKEWVIFPGIKVWVKYPDGLKLKEIEQLIIDEKGDKRKYELRFKNTLKTYPVNIGDTFISTPEQKTDTYMKLIKSFNLEPTHVFSFEGPILRLSYYSKEKTGTIPKLGVIIQPRQFY